MSSPIELTALLEGNKSLVYITLATTIVGYMLIALLNKARSKKGLAHYLEVPYFRSSKKLSFKDEMILSMLETTLEKGPCFVITDPDLPDNPIIYASPAFCAHTQYSKEEVENRNCRFLQGRDTKPSDIAIIRQAVENKTACSVCLLNYRKDGSTFANQFFLTPLFSEDGTKVMYYLGVQAQVPSLQPALKERENPGYKIFQYFKQ